MDDVIKYLLEDMLESVPNPKRHTEHQYDICYDALEELYAIVVTLLHNKELYHKVHQFVQPHKATALYLDLTTIDKPYDAGVLIVDHKGKVHETELTCDGV